MGNRVVAVVTTVNSPVVAKVFQCSVYIVMCNDAGARYHAYWHSDEASSIQLLTHYTDASAEFLLHETVHTVRQGWRR